MDLIAGFKGINNRVDPTALGMEWQLGADNALCDNARYLVQRPGYAEFATGVADAFGTRDGRLFVVSSTGVLYEVAADGSSRARTTGFSGAPFQWAELGPAIFAMSETTAWCIYPDRVVPWGVPMANIPTLSATSGDLEPGTYLVACALFAQDNRMGGSLGVASIELAAGQGLVVTTPEVAGYDTVAYVSPPDGDILYRALTLSGGSGTLTLPPVEGPELRIFDLYPPPQGSMIAAHGNRMCVAVWEPEYDRSVIYWSKPDQPHLFDVEADLQLVAGRITLLAQAGGALVIGTDRLIAAYGPPLQQIAEYGALQDTVDWDKDGRLVFGTDRGTCRFPPFENLTEAALTPDTRSYSTGAILHHQGTSYHLTVMRGGIRQRSPLAPYPPLAVVIDTGA